MGIIGVDRSAEGSAPNASHGNGSGENGCGRNGSKDGSGGSG